MQSNTHTYIHIHTHIYTQFDIRYNQTYPEGVRMPHSKDMICFLFCSDEICGFSSMTPYLKRENTSL